MKKTLSILLACLFLLPVLVYAEISLETEDETDQDIVEEEFTLITDDGYEIPDPFGPMNMEVQKESEENAQSQPEEEETEPDYGGAREELIDRIISLGQALYIKADGHSQRAHYKGDIYVCKNFTTYLFNQNRDDFRMAEYPGVRLVIPDNLPKAECKPYEYGIFWKNVSAAKGNPFYVAAQFLYDTSLSKEENMQLAMDFMRQVKRGDFFQMSAEYEYGTGAHSAIMVADYDSFNDSIHWMDSNMRGKKVKGIRYGIVQYNEEKSVEWWASTFCKKKRGATLYRLRDDIIFNPETAEKE